MPSRHDPADGLADIVENAGRVERYLAGMDRDAFGRAGMTRDAVERCLERVCEAVHRLGDQAELLRLRAERVLATIVGCARPRSLMAFPACDRVGGRHRVRPVQDRSTHG